MNVHDRTKVPQFLKMLDELTKYHIEIGIFGEDDSEMVVIASVHEFGATIKTESGKSIRIKERSYLRAGFDYNKQKIIKQADKLLEKVMRLQLKVSDFYKVLGEYIVGLIQRYLTELKNPPNLPATIKKKGSSNPLIDTTQLRQSIVYKVVKS